MDIQVCTVFTTALCNLNCRYCYICKDKNGGLKQIDDELAEMLESGRCIQQVLDYGENIEENLKTICLWGGEPALHLERFTNQVDKWFENFPNIQEFTISTNFTVHDEIEKLQALFKAIDKYGPKEKYKFDLQISMDGYDEMNDFGRGEGVTQKIKNNFIKLLEMPYNSDKIVMTVHPKATLSRETFKYLDTVDKCKKWVEFFSQEFYLPYEQAKVPFLFGLTLFNCAQPTEWTKEDGIAFANIIHNLTQLDPRDYPGWGNHYSFSPLANDIITEHINGTNYRAPMCGGTCGAYVCEINPIPHGKYTACHRGLFDEYVDYCNNIDNLDYMNGLSKAFYAPEDRSTWLMTLDDLRARHATLSPLIHCKHQIRYTDYIVIIREYARQGIIDEKYLDPSEIEKTLGYFLGGGYCMQNGYAQTGSWTTMDTYEVPLLYNGAMEYSVQELDKYIERMESI